MNRCIILGFLILFMAGIHAGELPTHFNVDTYPAWVKKQPIKTDIPDSPLPTSHFYSSHQVNLNKPELVNFYELSAKINNAQGISEISEIQVNYLPAFQRLIFHTIEIERAGKVIHKLQRNKFKLFQQEQELNSKLYSESWSALFIIEDLRVGDILSYSYSIIGENPVMGDKSFGGSMLSWHAPVQLMNFRLLTSGTPIYFNSSRIEQLKTIQQGNQYEYNINLNDAPAITPDDSAPTWFTPYDFIEYSEYKTWAGVVDWALPLYQDKYMPTNKINALVQDLTQDNSSIKQTVERIINYVQDDIRYFGIELGENSHKPSFPTETIKRRYGDCKDKSVLLVSMLRTLGIKAYPVLVSSYKKRRLLKLLPSPAAFNHVITVFELNNKRYWVDATITDQAGSLNNMTLPEYEYGLILKNSENKLTKIAEVDGAQSLNATIDFSEIFDIDNKKNYLTITSKMTFSGWRADQIRSYFKNYGPKIVTKDYQELYSRYYRATTQQQLVTFEDNVLDNKVSLHFQFNSTMAATQSAGRNEYEIYAFSLSEYLESPKVVDRKAPFQMLHPVAVNHNITINFSENTHLLWHQNLQEKNLNNEFFDFKIATTKQKKSIGIKYNYKTNIEHIEPSMIQAYLGMNLAAKRLLSFRFWTNKNLNNKSNFKQNKTRVKNLINKLMKKGS
ncbi:MAG: DUF3857 domain-containing protein [Gammaproteobacteria bacterium]|nr:DUF3857 domain-containing protein [Gammaproteobacteria bacterium]